MPTLGISCTVFVAVCNFFVVLSCRWVGTTVSRTHRGCERRLSALQSANPTRLGDAELVLKFRRALALIGRSAFVPDTMWTGKHGTQSHNIHSTSSVKTKASAIPSTDFGQDGSGIGVVEVGALRDSVTAANNYCFGDESRSKASIAVISRTTSRLTLELPQSITPEAAARLKIAHPIDDQPGPIAKSLNKSVADPSDIAEWHRNRRPMQHRHQSPRSRSTPSIAGPAASVASKPVTSPVPSRTTAKRAPSNVGASQSSSVPPNKGNTAKKRSVSSNQPLPSLDAMRAAVASKKAAAKAAQQAQRRNTPWNLSPKHKRSNATKTFPAGSLRKSGAAQASASLPSPSSLSSASKRKSTTPSSRAAGRKRTNVTGLSTGHARAPVTAAAAKRKMRQLQSLISPHVPKRSVPVGRTSSVPPQRKPSIEEDPFGALLGTSSTSRSRNRAPLPDLSTSRGRTRAPLPDLPPSLASPFDLPVQSSHGMRVPSALRQPASLPYARDPFGNPFEATIHGQTSADPLAIDVDALDEDLS